MKLRNRFSGSQFEGDGNPRKKERKIRDRKAKQNRKTFNFLEKNGFALPENGENDHHTR